MPTFVHGDNIAQKTDHRTKYRDRESLQFLDEIATRYSSWKENNLNLIGSDRETVNRRTELLNEYKDFIDQQHYAEKFDSRSNLHSTVIEEFLVYLFQGSVPNIEMEPVIGKGRTFKAFYLAAKSFADLLDRPSIRVETKDHDFAIGTTIRARFENRQSEELGSQSFQIPAVVIECKTYLDKTMLEGAAGAAEDLKRINPSARYIIVAEWLKLTESVNLQKYRIDQIYVLRRQRNTDREFRFEEGYVKNPIYPDLVWDLFQEVTSYLAANRWDIEAAIARGKLL